MVSDRAAAGATNEQFEGLLRPVLSRAYGVALHLTRNPADAEDLVQEAALNAFRGFGTFQTGTNFVAWFFRVLTNTFLSGKRRRRPEDGAEPLEDLPNAYLQRSAMETAGGEAAELARTVVGKLEREQVAAAIEALPEEYRTVSALYFLEDLAYQEIARILGIPVGTVRSRLHRGRRILQRRLWLLAQDHGLVPAVRREGR